MADPVYFCRLPIRARESSDDARYRLARQSEAHYAQRAAAKLRALAEGFPGITAATPVEPPFASWDTADICPIHHFLLIEHARGVSPLSPYALAAE